jgi:hypothetical protein
MIQPSSMHLAAQQEVTNNICQKKRTPCYYNAILYVKFKVSLPDVFKDRIKILKQSNTTYLF